MSKNIFNSDTWNVNYLSPIVLAAAIVISLFLGIAAFGKMFYPVEKLKELDVLTGLFEIIFIGVLFAFRMRKALWLGAAVVFASWGGYAIYWCCLKLPCSCMGAMITLPSTYALFLDAFFFMGSCAIAWMLGTLRRVLYLNILCAFLGGLVGYAFAEWVFYVKIIGVVWHLL